MEVAKTQLDAKTKSLEAAEKQHQDLVTRTTQIEEQLKRVTESVRILKGGGDRVVTNRMPFFLIRRQTKGESWLLNSKRRLLTWKNR